MPLLGELQVQRVDAITKGTGEKEYDAPPGLPHQHAAVKIPRSAARVTDTPNASMTTLASPTQGGTTVLSLWRVTMRAGQRGPEHSFDVEQAWPAGLRRQIGTGSGATFVVSGQAGGSATPISPEGPGEPVSPAWIG